MRDLLDSGRWLNYIMADGSISIAMATYNGEKYLPEQLESLLRQTHAPHELVVGDDGSTDSTAEIVQEFARRAPFAVAFQQNPRRLGYADNFLATAARCKGEWVGFCDQDDVWLENKLLRVHRAIEVASDAALIAHRAIVVNDALSPLGALVPKQRWRNFTEPLNLPLSAKLPGFCCIIRASLLRILSYDDRPPNFLFDNDARAHDKWIVWLANIFGRTVFIPEPLALHRRHDHNTSRFEMLRANRPSRERKRSATFFEFRSRVAMEYSIRLIDACDSIQNPSFDEAARRGADYYSNVSRWYRLRAQLCVCGKRTERIRTILSLIKSRAYFRRNVRALGLRALVVDLMRTLG